MTLICGHVFCYDCLEQRAAVGNNFCPNDKVQYATPITQLSCCHAILAHLPNTVRRELHCKRHINKRIKFICEDHKEYLCTNCVIEHTGIGHTVKSFVVDFKQEKERVVNMQVRLQALTRILKKYIEKIEKKAITLYEYIDKQQAKLKYEYNKTLKLIAQKQKALLEEFAGVVQSSRNDLSNSLVANNKSLTKLKSIIEQFNNINSIFEYNKRIESAENALKEVQIINKVSYGNITLKVIQVNDKSELKALTKRLGNYTKDKVRGDKKRSKKYKKGNEKEMNKKEDAVRDESGNVELYETPEDSDIVNIQ